VLRLEGKPGQHSIHALRALLKALLRRDVTASAGRQHSKGAE
jgi:hypothetical protein